jgi:hypothetical protein
LLKPNKSNKLEDEFDEASNLFNSNLTITNSDLMVEKSRFKSFQTTQRKFPNINKVKKLINLLILNFLKFVFFA